MPDWLQRDWCSSFVLTLGHFLWQGILIAALLAIVLRAVRPVAARYWLSLAALLLMAVCPIATFGWLLQPEKPVAVVETTPVERDAADAPVIGATDVADVPETGLHDSKWTGRDVGLAPVAEPSLRGVDVAMPASAPVVERSWWQRFAPQLMVTYLGGVALMLLRLVAGLWGGRRLRRRVQLIDDSALLAAMQRQGRALGLKLLPVLAYCERVTVPTVVGVLKPMILLPIALTSGLSPEQIESVLAHELAHLRRYDHLVNLLQRVIESLLFFHPAMWWVSHRIRQEREHCCDDLVVACGAMPLDYAKSLLRVAELSRATKLRRPVAAVSLLATDGKPSNLRQRIARLLGESATPSLRLSPRALLLTIAVPLVALIATLQSGASHQPSSFIERENELTETRSQALPEDANPEAAPEVSSAEPATSDNGDDAKTKQEAEPRYARPQAEPGNEKIVWSEVVNGLRARVVPVSPGMSDEVINLTERVAAFETLDDVTFAVEIQNASDKPVSLRELRYGEHYGESKGKLASDWFGQFLFSIDYFDASGKRVERPELIPLGKQFGMSDAALTSTLAPKQTLKMLLRPNRWISALSQQPLVGQQRAVVRYRGAAMDGNDKRVDVVSPAVEFSVMRRGYRPSGAPSPQLGDDPKNDPELEPDITKLLVWGPTVNGLRAALDVVTESRSKGISHGTKPKLKLVVQNVSQNVGDMPVKLASLMWLSELPITAKNAVGEDIPIQSSWYSGITPAIRVLLKPQQIVTFDAGNVGLAVTKERADAFEHVTHRRLVAPRGKYLLKGTERFGTSFVLKDGDGKVVVPVDGDFKGELTTGSAKIDISNEIIEGEIVDAVTGKPVEGATVSFGIVKPKTANSDEQRLALMAWGPMSPSKIYFTIPDVPEDIAQRADRDELEVRFGVGNHPDYENFAPEERIPLKEFFHEGPKTAIKVLSRIKLTPKKKAAGDQPVGASIGLLPGGREVELMAIAHASVVTKSGTQRKADSWWKADGTAFDKQPFEKLHPLSVATGKKHFREVVIRLATRPIELASPENAKRPAWNGDLWWGARQQIASAISWDGNSNLLHHAIVGFEEEKSATVSFYYTTAPSVVAGTIAPDGKITASDSASEPLKAWLRDVKVASVEQAGKETVVKLNRWYSQIMSSQIVVNAIALDGTIVTANTPSDPDRAVFKLLLEDVDAFQIVVRPMTHRVDCENVALIPGQKSEPRVIVTPLDECFSIKFRKDGKTLGILSEARPQELAELLKGLQHDLNSETGELIVTSHKPSAFEFAERIVKQLKADGWKWPTITLTPLEKEVESAAVDADPAGRGTPTPVRDSAIGFPNADEVQRKGDNPNGDLRSDKAPRLDDPHHARAIEQAVAFLKARQQEGGVWQGEPADGVTALAAAALLKTGVKVDDPAIQKAVAHLRKVEPELSYTVALQTMVFCWASPKEDAELIKRNVAWLEKAQVVDGKLRGAWSYAQANGGRGDGSCSRFAVLGLDAAKRAGFEVKDETWQRVSDYWLTTQKENGSWGYTPEAQATLTMTLAGVAGLATANRHLPRDKQTEKREAAMRKSEKFIEQSLPDLPKATFALYALQSLERAGHLSGILRFGDLDWKTIATKQLLETQHPTGFWKSASESDVIATSLALLTLTGQSESNEAPGRISRHGLRQPAAAFALSSLLLKGCVRGWLRWLLPQV